MSKQASLFKYGFTRQFQHRNETYNFTAAGDIVPKTNGIYKCHSCTNKCFRSKQGLASQTMLAHPSSRGELKSEAALNVYNIKIEKQVKITLDNLLTSAETEMSKPSTDTDEKIGFAIKIDITNVPDDDNAERIVRKRKRYDFTFKMDVIDQVYSGILPMDVA